MKRRMAAVEIPAMAERGRDLDVLELGVMPVVVLVVVLEGGETTVSFLGTLVSGKRACEIVKVLRS